MGRGTGIQELIRQRRMYQMKILTLVNSLSSRALLSKIYKQSYKTKYVGHVDKLSWRKSSYDDGVTLFDTHYQQHLVYIPPTMDDVFLLPPIGKTGVEKRINVDKKFFFTNVPNMPKEVMYEVFKYIPPLELLKSVRLVCKKWNHIITTTEEYWVHRQWKTSPWKQLPLFRQYILHNMIGITQRRFINFIFKHPEYLGEILNMNGKPTIALDERLTFGPFVFCKRMANIYQCGYKIQLHQLLTRN